MATVKSISDQSGVSVSAIRSVALDLGVADVDDKLSFEDETKILEAAEALKVKAIADSANSNGGQKSLNGAATAQNFENDSLLNDESFGSDEQRQIIEDVLVGEAREWGQQLGAKIARAEAAGIADILLPHRTGIANSFMEKLLRNRSTGDYHLQASS